MGAGGSHIHRVAADQCEVPDSVRAFLVGLVPKVTPGGRHMCSPALEVDVPPVPGYVRSGLALAMVPPGGPQTYSPAVDTEGEMQVYCHRWFSADHTGPVRGEPGGNTERAQDSHGMIVEKLRMKFLKPRTLRPVMNYAIASQARPAHNVF